MKIPPFKLERYFAKYEFTAPYLLCSSDCESFSVRELLEFEPGSAEAFQEHWLGYTESQGDLRLREEIARLYRQISVDEILVHAGAEEAIFGFINTMLSAGDHVIVHYPCYTSLVDLATAAGCRVTNWAVAEEDNWELDLDFLLEEGQLVIGVADRLASLNPAIRCRGCASSAPRTRRRRAPRHRAAR